MSLIFMTAALFPMTLMQADGIQLMRWRVFTEAIGRVEGTSSFLDPRAPPRPKTYSPNFCIASILCSSQSLKSHFSFRGSQIQKTPELRQLSIGEHFRHDQEQRAT